MTFGTAPVGEVTSEPEMWTPEETRAGATFSYVDIGSIDAATKRIRGASTVAVAEAPSRARQIVKSGDILVSTVRPNLNAVAVVPPELDGAIASTGFAVLRPDTTKVDGPYLLHWVCSPQFIRALVTRATGASYPAVTEAVVRAAQLPLPPLAEQRRIAAVLDKADGIRRKRRESLKLLEEFLRSAFLEMFGDPVRNEQGWELVAVERLASGDPGGVIIGPFGSDLKVGDYQDEGHPVVFVRDIKAGRFEWSSSVYVSSAKFNQLAAHQVRAGDVLVTKMGLPPGIAAVYDAAMPIGVVTADVIRMTCDPGSCVPEYVAAAINSPHGHAQVAKLTEGATRPKVTLRGFRALTLRLPPITLQRRYANVVASVKRCRDRCARASAASDALFDSLAQRAFGGGVAV